jgi:hypothetical protein
VILRIIARGVIAKWLSSIIPRANAEVSSPEC